MLNGKLLVLIKHLIEHELRLKFREMSITLGL